MPSKGVVACGHEETARTAQNILQEGGNAFDAVVASFFSACTAEPVLASLGGGGFLLAQTADGNATVYDFFAHTPLKKRPEKQTDFYPIKADFGTTTQEFHIGLGSIAIPGCVRGMFHIHRELCTLPMTRLMEPGIQLARQGLPLNSFQAYIFGIVKSILLATPTACEIFGNRQQLDEIISTGDIFKQPELADTLEALSREGDALFYDGDIAQSIQTLCSSGGHVSRDDLSAYRVVKREPLSLHYHGARLLTNPPPSSGGILVAFALRLIEEFINDDHTFGNTAYLRLLTEVMSTTNLARQDKQPEIIKPDGMTHLLNPEYLEQFKQQVQGRTHFNRGTTHMSVMDDKGNIASLSVSNGEGCGHIVPGTGIMLNNMLGEEDLNPQGFHHWSENERITSMMSPSILHLPDKRCVVLGSGGSNRIRSAILQVLINLIDFNMPLDKAVTSPRIHFENSLLNIEHGFNQQEITSLISHHPENKVWEACNLFFGGVHSVMRDTQGFTGAGDPRRGGVSVIA